MVSAATVIERQIGRLHKELETCRNRAETCIGQCDRPEKAVTLNSIKNELDACSFQLEEIATILGLLQKKKLDVDALCSETAVFLENHLRQAPPTEDQDFSASSISPLA